MIRRVFGCLQGQTKCVWLWELLTVQPACSVQDLSARSCILSLYGSAVSTVSRISRFNGVAAQRRLHSSALVAWRPASSVLLIPRIALFSSLLGSFRAVGRAPYSSPLLCVVLCCLLHSALFIVMVNEILVFGKLLRENKTLPFTRTAFFASLI